MSPGLTRRSCLNRANGTTSLWSEATVTFQLDNWSTAQKEAAKGSPKTEVPAKKMGVESRTTQSEAPLQLQIMQGCLRHPLDHLDFDLLLGLISSDQIFSTVGGYLVTKCGNRLAALTPPIPSRRLVTQPVCQNRARRAFDGSI